MNTVAKTLKEKVIEVLSHLPVSESRVPYTYHHDYLRNHVDEFSNMSRSEVASRTEEHTEEQLYGICLLGAVESSDIFSILKFPTVKARNLYCEVLEQSRQIVEQMWGITEN